jgi:hypothetical protein
MGLLLIMLLMSSVGVAGPDFLAGAASLWNASAIWAADAAPTQDQETGEEPPLTHGSTTIDPFG